MKIQSVFVKVAIGFLLLAGTPAHALTISDFSIFGLGTVTIGAGSSIDSGLVGSGTEVSMNGATTIKKDVYVDSTGNGGEFTAGNGVHVDGNIRATGLVHLGGTNVVGGNVDSGDKVGSGNRAFEAGNGGQVVGSVTHPTGTTLQLNSTTIGANVIGTPQPVTPFLPNLPASTVFSSGGTNYTGLGNSFDLSLAPNISYGQVQGGGAGKLRLSAGNYFFDSINLGNSTQLILDLAGGPINIYVTGTATFGSVDVLLKNNVGNANQIYLEAHGTGNNVFQAGGGSDWLGTVYTPLGDIHFGGGGCCSTFVGHFWAGLDVDIEHSVTGTLPDSTVPEPASWLLLGVGLIGLLAWHRNPLLHDRSQKGNAPG